MPGFGHFSTRRGWDRGANFGRQGRNRILWVLATISDIGSGGMRQMFS